MRVAKVSVSGTASSEKKVWDRKLKKTLSSQLIIINKKCQQTPIETLAT